MKKLKKVILFFVLFIVLLWACSIGIQAVVRTTQGAVSGRSRVFASVSAEKKNTIDVLVAGDSESYTSVSPMDLWDQTGIAAYDCGQPGQKIQETYYMLKTAFKTQSPKLVLFETNTIFRDPGILKNVQLSLTEPLAYHFPVIKYHNAWKALFDGPGGLKKSYKGFEIRDKVVSYEGDEEYIAIAESLKEAATKLVRYSNNLPQEARVALKNTESMLFLINFISANSDIDYQSKQELLEIDDVKERAIKLLELMGKQISLLELKNDQQMKTIQDELGGNPTDEEFKELEDRAAQKEWDENVKKIFYKELDKLKRLNPQSPDYSVQSNYLHEMLELPWNHCSEDNLDLGHAKEMLDADHFGLEKVKDRILEYLAVLKLKADMKSPILCLYGPPGVGKTSLGKSVAKAINREFVRMSLGGLHDEAEIRGHRKTYIGAMPGRILQNIKKAGTSNPVFILDEIDKVGTDFRGDPQSALLEVLDPEQNNAFHDNFLDIDYDLSKVMFIATANDLSTIAPALRDRNFCFCPEKRKER